MDVFQNMQMFITTMLEENAQKYSNYPAIISNNEQISYIDLYKKVNQVVSQLEELVSKDIRNIGLLFHSPINLMVFHLALYRLDICQTVLSPFDTLVVHKQTIELTYIDVIIQDIGLTESLLLNVNIVSIDKNFKIVNLSTLTERKKISTDQEKYATIFLGSGTTGVPKIIAIDSITMVNTIYRDIQMCLSLNYKEKDTFFSSSSVYFTFPRRFIIGTLFLGLTILLPQKKSQYLMNYVKEYNIDHLLLTSSQARNLVLQEKNKDIGLEEDSLYESLKSLLVFGAPVSEPLRKKIYTTITKNFSILYGANEFGQITTAKLDDIEKYPYTIGKAEASVEVRIMDEEGRPCFPTQSGLIAVKTYFMIGKYLNNPIATKKHFKNGYFYPGDIGYLTPDGQLIFEGRADDMMIYSGANIYPIEIESVLDTHPNVEEAAVFPLKIDSQEQLPFAVVTLIKKTSEQELLNWCRKILGWKHPVRIFTIKRMPRNTLGKVLKKELAKKIAKSLSR